MLEKTYSSGEIEKKYYATWEKSGAFKAGKGKDPYVIMMPPANVTGTLHLGHALTFTLQDILIRYHRMKGRNVLWQPGTDHAGIATQMVVERQLEAQGISRHDLGREKFLEKVWEWKALSGGAIIDQLKRLGASADWDRERFTMDGDYTKAVTHAFVTLYEKGLIYRAKRLVNWDVKYQTAISDLEVEHREEKGKLYYFKYPLEKGGYITVATTRPETLFGDTAIAVHPEDDRYKDIIGQQAKVPFTNRTIPIIADDYCDPTKGTGAVKITPAHDFTDFEVGTRHQLPFISIMDSYGKLNQEVPPAFQGLDANGARPLVLEGLQNLGLWEKEEDITHPVPYGDRSGKVIEPRLTDQWFVNTTDMAARALDAVKKKDTVFVPEGWDKTYYEWLENIQPWCISRQIWWGHQIPAWYGPDGKVFVAATEDAAQEKAQAQYGQPVSLRRDEDVLDTWFSSGLWPFATLGWPDTKSEDLEKYYPGAVLVTGFDIIFFWVARMMMMGLEFMGRIPFKEVYIHPLVRDAKGQKMSKSKGNVIDPLHLIDTYGADALRFTLCHLAAPGRDIKLSEEKVASSRNFITKLWNAARYLEMNNCRWIEAVNFYAKHPVNRWIIAKVNHIALEAEGALEYYGFHKMAGDLYHFAWDTFCDWYVEFSKPLLASDDAELQAETRQTLALVMGQLCHLLHPIMPFMTEEIWQSMDGKGLLIEQSWPSQKPLDANAPQDRAAEKELDWVIEVITALRALRANMNIPAGAKLDISIKEATAEVKEYLTTHREILCRVGRLKEIQMQNASSPHDGLQLIVPGGILLVSLEGIIDKDKEQARLTKELEKVHQELTAVHQKLTNPQIMAKAPAHIIEEYELRQATFKEKAASLTKALEALR